MKKILTIVVAFVIAMPFASAFDTAQIQAGNQESLNNSLNLRIDRERTVKLGQLLQEEEKLQSEYEKEAANLNASIEGASTLTLERFHTQQDSICMDIRSKIVDVRLQIDEIK